MRSSNTPVMAPRSAGATILSELEDNPYAVERQYRAEDLEGHRWMFAS